jgi:hypothetical protein
LHTYSKRDTITKSIIEGEKKDEKKTNHTNILWKWLVFLILQGLLVVSCQLDMDLQKQAGTIPTDNGPNRDWDTGYTSDSHVYGDFNGDGYEDSIFYNEAAKINSIVNAGKITVDYGNNAITDQEWHQDSPGILGACEQNDYFGWHASAGDFNGDGYDDVAVGVTNESIGSIQSAGCVNVIYGSASGLTSTGNQLWNQNTSGISGACEDFDHFGGTLCAADFNNDGYADLAVAAAHESIGNLENAGAVHIILGSSSGLTATGDQFWHLNVNNTPNQAVGYTYFGDYLATGEFNNDDYYDLIIGVPMMTIDGTNGAGAVYYFPGCANGLTASGSQEWTAGSDGIDNGILYTGYFGSTLLVGDFNNIPGDGLNDLAIGYKYATVNGQSKAGAVYVLYGTSSTGFRSDRICSYHRYTLGVPGVPTSNDNFGKYLKSGQYDSQDYEDILVKSDILDDAYLYGYKWGMTGQPF